MNYTKLLKKKKERDFPDGPVAKTMLPMQRTRVQSLFRELDPIFDD